MNAEYIKAISEAKRRKWKEFVEGVDGESIWQVKRYIMNQQSQPYILTLDNNSITNDEKTETFQKAFFPSPPTADLTDISLLYTYPQEVPYQPTITLH